MVQRILSMAPSLTPRDCSGSIHDVQFTPPRGTVHGAAHPANGTQFTPRDCSGSIHGVQFIPPRGTVHGAAHPVNGTQFTPQGLFRIYPRRPVYPHPEGLFMVQRILAMTGLFTMQPILSTTSSSPAQSQRHKHPLTSPFIPILLPPHFAFLPLANCESGKCYKLC